MAYFVLTLRAVSEPSIRPYFAFMRSACASLFRNGPWPNLGRTLPTYAVVAMVVGTLEGVIDALLAAEQSGW